jgi:hypothetical protein
MRQWTKLVIPNAMRLIRFARSFMVSAGPLASRPSAVERRRETSTSAKVSC